MAANHANPCGALLQITSRLGFAGGGRPGTGLLCCGQLVFELAPFRVEQRDLVGASAAAATFPFELASLANS